MVSDVATPPVEQARANLLDQCEGNIVTAIGTAESDLDRGYFFIDGAWAQPRGTETHQALEAATGEPLGSAALGAGVDIDAAVTAARAALDGGPWGRPRRPNARR